MAAGNVSCLKTIAVRGEVLFVPGAVRSTFLKPGALILGDFSVDVIRIVKNGYCRQIKGFFSRQYGSQFAGKIESCTGETLQKIIDPEKSGAFVNISPDAPFETSDRIMLLRIPSGDEDTLFADFHGEGFRMVFGWIDTGLLAPCTESEINIDLALLGRTVNIELAAEDLTQHVCHFLCRKTGHC